VLLNEALAAARVLVTVIFVLPELNVTAPATDIAPLWVRAPTELTLRLPTLMAPKTVAREFTTEAALEPVLVRLTAPVNAFPAFVSVMAFDPALKTAVPPTTNTPLWVIAPLVVILRSPGTVNAGRVNAPLVVILRFAGTTNDGRLKLDVL
jgi:hypothetical protein